MRYLATAFVLMISAAAVFAQEAGSPNQAATQKFYDDTSLVTKLFVDGDHDGARKLAKSLLNDAEGFPKDWNYGNAIHAANIVLGRIALKEDDLKAAGELLIAAGKTPGSPQLDTFGPDMNLARELLVAGERKIVQEYFGLCGKFWKMNDGRLKEWTQLAEQGRVPEFGANLRYFSPARTEN